MDENNNSLRQPNINTSSDLNIMVEAINSISKDNKELRQVLSELKNSITSDKTSSISAKQLDKLLQKYFKTNMDTSTTSTRTTGRSRERARYNYLEEEQQRINFQKIKREIEEREHNVKSISNFTNSFEGLNKNITNLSSEISKEVRKLSTNKLSVSVHTIERHLGTLGDSVTNYQNRLNTALKDSGIQEQFIKDITSLTKLKSKLSVAQDIQKVDTETLQKGLDAISSRSKDILAHYIGNMEDAGVSEIISKYLQDKLGNTFTSELNNPTNMGKYFSELTTNDISSEIEDILSFVTTLTEKPENVSNTEAIKSLKEGLSGVQTLITDQRRRFEEPQQEKVDKSTELIDSIKEEIQRLEESTERQYSEAEMIAIHNDTLAEINEPYVQALSDMLKLQSDTLLNNKELIDSIKEYSDPTGYTKSVETQLQSWKDFLHPKESESYLQVLGKLDDQIQAITDTIQSLSNQQSELAKESIQVDSLISSTRDLITNSQSTIKLLEEQGLTQRAEEEKANLQALQMKLEEYTAQKDVISQQNELIDKQKDFLDDQEENLRNERKQLEQNTTFTKNATSKVLTKVQSFALDSINKFTSNLQSAADKMFSAIEDTQKSIGKTLKMTSGEYDKYVNQMQALAKEQGVSVTSDQLLQLSEAVVNVGVTNTDLLGQLAVGQARLSETGTFFNVDEEFLKTIQRQYDADIRAGMSQEEAYQNIQKWYDTLIATQQGLTDKFGSATALASGGSNEILNILNEFVKSGQMQAEDAQQNYIQIAGLLQSIDEWGGDSSQMLSVLNSIKDNPMGELSTEMLAFLQSIGKTQDDVINAINSGDMASLLQDYLSFVSNTYVGDSRTGVLYERQAYSSELTADQIYAIKNFSDNISDTFEKNALTESDIANITADITESVSKGDYLTAQEKYEKQQLEAVEEVAQGFQKLPDGQFWMDKGFSAISDIVNEGAKFVTDLMIAKLMGSQLFGNLISKGLGSGTSTPGIGSFDWKNLLGKPTNVFKSTEIPMANQVSAMLGGVQSVTVAMSDIISGIQEGDSASDILYNTLTDSKFTAGLGGTIGGAIGGPIGAVIGEGLGALIPTLDEGISNTLVSIFDGDFNKKELKREQQQLEYIKESTQELSKASKLHQDVAREQLQNLQEQSSIFNEFDDNQKKQWLIDNEIATAQSLNNQSTEETNNLFNEAVSNWIEQQQKQIQEEQTKSDILQSSIGSIGQVLGVDNMLNYTLEDLADTQGLSEKMISDLLKHRDYATAQGIDIEDLQSGNVETDKLLKAYNALAEHKMNVRIMSNQEGFEQLEQLKSIMDKGQSLADVIQEVYGDSGYTQENLQELTRIFEELNNKQNIRENNSFAEGLNYVPYDEFPATLHEGEMVLTKEEAEDYRNNSVTKMLSDNAKQSTVRTIADIGTTNGGKFTNTPLDITPITNSVNSQTDRIERLLIKILEVMSSPTNNTYPSRLQKSLVQLNADLSLL